MQSLAWLANTWVGTLGTDTIEEHWTSAQANTMMGMFRRFDAEAVKFYEFLAIELEADIPYLRMVHFSPGLTSWEEKGSPTEFRLAQLEGTKAIWEPTNPDEDKWIVYELTPQQQLQVILGRGQQLLNPMVFTYEAKA